MTVVVKLVVASDWLFIEHYSPCRTAGKASLTVPRLAFVGLPVGIAELVLGTYLVCRLLKKKHISVVVPTVPDRIGRQ